MDTDDAAIEAQRLEELRQIKRATLHELDKQAAQYTAALIPPHIQTERQRLRRELGIVESVIASPLSPSIGDELGEASRFVAYLEQVRAVERTTLEAIARIEERVNAGLSQLAERLDQADEASMQWRRWGTVALVILVVVVVTMALVGVYQLGRMDGAFVKQVLGLWR